ncbi:MAG TPA: phosphate uptake regulator PhoU [Thermoplasmata archaeon]|nr:phosphate uptake regulator PhoU [Thermoplasmata archaeon]
MESRKIQKVGAATLTISLPKEWTERRNLKKGDALFIVEEGETLRILPGAAAEGRERITKEYVVDADLCEIDGMLERVIVGNYVLGRERIIVRSSTRLRSAHQDEVRRAVRRLMGMGIIEETPSRVVLQCSIDPANYPIEALLKRLYNLGATMLSESCEALAKGDAALAEDAMKREDDADTMYWLILRLILLAQMDEALVEKLGMRSRLEIAGNRAIARDLEVVADHCYDIAGAVKELIEQDQAIPASVLKALQRLADVIGRAYGKALGALLSRDLKQANEALLLSDDLSARVQDLSQAVMRGLRDPQGALPFGRIYSGFVHVGGYARSIALIAFNRYLEKPTNLSRPSTPSG